MLTIIFFMGSVISKIFLRKRDPALFEPKLGVKFLTRNIYEKFIIFETWFLNPYTKKFYDIEEEDIIVDVGGHLGSFAIYGSHKAKKGKVIVYEPSKDNFDTLIKNLEMNEVRNVVTHNQAVTDKNGLIEFYTSDTITSSASLYENLVSSNKSKVYSVRLVDIFKNNNIDKIDFLKIDVEGAEYDILLSSGKEILKKIKCIALEYHDFMENGNYQQIVRHLRKHKFKIENKQNIIDKFFRRGHLRAVNLEWY